VDGAHATVKHELLVRYLDAWTPLALHRHRAAWHVSWADAEAARVALRVFGEFTDILADGSLTLVARSADDLPAVAGVQLSIVDSLAAPRKGTSVFAWLDGASADDVSTVASWTGGPVELLAAAFTGPLPLPLTCRVELVSAGGSEPLVFATAAERSLERFKEELWALDEYAGIQLRDPADADGGLCDISAVAHLGPLRRMMLRHLAGSPQTVAELRAWTLHGTIFRPGDATRAVQALLTAGSVTRDPAAGRLSPDTVISPR
jgi:hypothetical protein